MNSATLENAGISTLSQPQVEPTPLNSKRNLKKSLVMVFGCTILGAAAQILIKSGLKLLPQSARFFELIMAGLMNWQLMAGLCLYGCSTILLVLALRYGELSMLYPVIALTYVWVAMLSLFFFHESINIFKAAGLVLIVGGVCVLGFSQQKHSVPVQK
jgi:drug/metabolite transporter (DMT)-like permease